MDQPEADGDKGKKPPNPTHPHPPPNNPKPSYYHSHQPLEYPPSMTCTTILKLLLFIKQTELKHSSFSSPLTQRFMFSL